MAQIRATAHSTARTVPMWGTWPDRQRLHWVSGTFLWNVLNSSPVSWFWEASSKSTAYTSMHFSEMFRRLWWFLILKLQRLIRIFSKINRSESFTTHSKLIMLCMLRAATTDTSIKLPSSTQNLSARLCVALLCLFLPDSKEIFLLLPSSNPYLLPRQGAVWISALPHGCSARACKKSLHPLIPGFYQWCVEHEAQLSHLPGSSLLPTHSLTGGFYFSCVLSSHKVKQKWQFTHLSYQVSIFSMDQDNSPETF